MLAILSELIKKESEYFENIPTWKKELDDERYMDEFEGVTFEELFKSLKKTNADINKKMLQQFLRDIDNSLVETEWTEGTDIYPSIIWITNKGIEYWCKKKNPNDYLIQV